jgi:hypothetical protein
MKLVRRATAIALEQGSDRLTLEILARSYDERLAADNSAGENPFLRNVARRKDKAA